MRLNTDHQDSHLYLSEYLAVSDASMMIERDGEQLVISFCSEDRQASRLPFPNL